MNENGHTSPSAGILKVCAVHNLDHDHGKGKGALPKAAARKCMPVSHDNTGNTSPHAAQDRGGSGQV